MGSAAKCLEKGKHKSFWQEKNPTHTKNKANTQVVTGNQEG